MVVIQRENLQHVADHLCFQWIRQTTFIYWSDSSQWRWWQILPTVTKQIQSLTYCHSAAKVLISLQTEGNNRLSHTRRPIHYILSLLYSALSMYHLSRCTFYFIKCSQPLKSEHQLISIHSVPDSITWTPGPHNTRHSCKSDLCAPK